MSLKIDRKQKYDNFKSKLDWFRERDNRRRLIGWLNFVLALSVIVITKIGISGFNASVFYEVATYISAGGFMIASMIILYDFSDKGEYDERQTELVKEVDKKCRDELQPITDLEKLGLALNIINDSDRITLIEERRKEIIDRLSYKLANATAVGNQRKVDKLKAKIEYYKQCSISISFRPIKVKDIISNGNGIRSKQDEINFSPKKAIRTRGKYSIMVKPLISIFLTSSVVATFTGVVEAIIYLGIVVPILLVQCLWVYEKARYYTSEDYVISVKNKISLIKKIKHIISSIDTPKYDKELF